MEEGRVREDGGDGNGEISPRAYRLMVNEVGG